MKSTTINFRPLGKAREVARASGFDISYAYEDLVFSEHNLFIIKFHERDNSKLLLYFNVDCDPEEAKIIEKKMQRYAPVCEMRIVKKGHFLIKQKGQKEELEINFIE
jgi:hypothetical protein